MKLLMFLMFFLFVGGFFIISNENLRLNSGENVGAFFDLYLTRIYDLKDNSGVIVGYVVKMGWLPNQTESLELG